MDRKSWNAWGDEPEPVKPHRDGTISLLWMKLRRLAPTRPTATEDHEGQLRYDRDGDVTGKAYLARYLAGGTYDWKDLTNTALTDLTDLALSSPRDGSVIAYDGAAWRDRLVYHFALGPFVLNDVPGTATTDMAFGYFNTATAVSQATIRQHINRAGYVVGAMITSDTDRTAGSATVKVNVSTTSTAYNAGAVVLDASHVRSHSDFAIPSSGIAISAGDTIGMQVATSGWTPTTANFVGWLLIQIGPFD